MKILAAVDFSQVSTRVLTAAMAWAARLGDEVEVVHVVHAPPALPHEVRATTGVFVAGLTEAAEREMNELCKNTQRLPSVPMIPLATRVIFGKPSLELGDHARRTDARMIVMGSHGKSEAARWLLGSVTERTIHSADRPVLVVPDKPAADTSAAVPERIVIALDRGAVGRATSAWAAELRKKLAFDAIFVHGFDARAEHRRLGVDGPYHELGDDPEVLLILRRDLAPMTQLPGVGESHLVIRPEPRDADRFDLLGIEADIEGATLIITGAVPHRFRVASEVTTTLRHAKVPVLCVPARAARPESQVQPAAEIPRLQRVLAATDLSLHGNRALVSAYQLLRESGGVVDLCHVVDEPAPANQEAAIKRAKVTAEVNEQLRALVPPDAEIRNIRTRVHVVPASDVRQAILQTSERLGADVVVLGSHGRGGPRRLERAVLGSVADGVVRDSRKPVLVVNAPRGEAEN